jgi:hypothetical protein
MSQTFGEWKNFPVTPHLKLPNGMAFEENLQSSYHLEECNCYPEEMQGGMTLAHYCPRHALSPFLIVGQRQTQQPLVARYYVPPVYLSALKQKIIFSSGSVPQFQGAGPRT